MSGKTESLYGLKAKMTTVQGRITWAIKKIETACVEFVKKNEKTAPTLTINRQAQEILENREKLEKELKKNMEHITIMSIDAIATSAPMEVDEDQVNTVSKIAEDLEA